MAYLLDSLDRTQTVGFRLSLGLLPVLSIGALPARSTRLHVVRRSLSKEDGDAIGDWLSGLWLLPAFLGERRLR